MRFAAFFVLTNGIGAGNSKRSSEKYGRRMKTYLPKVGELQPRWHLIDADGQILGRLAVQIATIIRGRHKPTYTPHLDTGDFVVIINADKVRVTGDKEHKKLYKSWSQYFGGQKTLTLHEVRERKPTMLIEEAVWGMMPKGRLGRQMMGKLKVYAGAEHPHQAQKPEPLNV
jgi:large subunit ribosomal protein L13